MNNFYIKQSPLTGMVGYGGGGTGLTFNSASGPLHYGNRGLFAGGYAGGEKQNIIEYISIDSTGNATDFGDLLEIQNRSGMAAGGGIGCQVGGLGNSGYLDRLQYVTIATTGNATDQGNLSQGIQRAMSASNGQRAVCGGGYQEDNSLKDDMEYWDLTSNSNSSTFGDLITGRNGGEAMGGATRIVFARGGDGNNNDINTMEYITVQTTGNATSFGSVGSSGASRTAGGASNPDYGIMAGGQIEPGNTPLDNIYKITIMTAANANDIGDLVNTRRNGAGVGNVDRFCQGGGDHAGDDSQIQYLSFINGTNASDFGDLSQNRMETGGCSGD